MHEGVGHQFTMDTQIIFIPKSQAHRGGHISQTQLDAGSIWYLINDVGGNGLDCFIGIVLVYGGKRSVCLSDDIHLTDMNLVPVPVDPRGIIIDLDDDNLRCFPDEVKKNLLPRIHKTYTPPHPVGKPPERLHPVVRPGCTRYQSDSGGYWYSPQNPSRLQPSPMVPESS